MSTDSIRIGILGGILVFATGFLLAPPWKSVLAGSVASLLRLVYRRVIEPPRYTLSYPARWLNVYQSVRRRAAEALDAQERIEKAYLDFRLVVAAQMIFYLPPAMVDEVERLRGETGRKLEELNAGLSTSPAALRGGIAPLQGKLSDIEDLLEKQARLLKLIVRMPKSAGYLNHKRQLQLQRKRQKERQKKEDERAAEEKRLLETYKARLAKAIQDAAVLSHRGMPVNGNSRFLKADDAERFWVEEMGRIEIAETQGSPAKEIVQAVDRLAEIIAAYGYKAQQVKATEDEFLELIELHARLESHGKTAFTAQELEPVLVALQVTVPGHWSRGEWEEMEHALLAVESFVRERRPVIRRELFISEHPTGPLTDRPEPISPSAVTRPLPPLEEVEKRRFAAKWVPVRTESGLVIEVDESLVHLYRPVEDTQDDHKKG
ncbi:MAG: hypothetical protein ACRDHY_01945 [Anaerolineales bacterium]